MFKYQITLLISCTLSALLFSFVRLKNQFSEMTIISEKEQIKLQTDPDNQKCLGLTPYSVIVSPPHVSIATICLGGYFKNVDVNCPNDTMYNLKYKRCEKPDPCFHREDGTLIEATDAVNLPKNRRYHICQGNVVVDTQVCPDHKPYFNGKTCVESDACSYLAEGTKFADVDNQNKYYMCQDKQAVHQSCPPGNHFFIYNCILNNICDHKDNTTQLVDPENAFSYFQCHHNKAIKRKCESNEIFSSYKRMCIPYNQCSGKKNSFIPIDNPYLKRTRHYIKCDHEEILYREMCPEKQVFDETISTCRGLDECLDLKEGKLFPHSDSSFTSCLFKTPQVVDITLKINQYTGETTNRCTYIADGTKLGHHTMEFTDPDKSTQYIICQNEKAHLQHCPEDHIFANRKCTFSPCITRPAGTIGHVIDDPLGIYYCKDSLKYTFKKSCPEGTHRSPTFECVPDPHYVAQPRRPPVITSQFSYTDSEGTRHSCRDNFTTDKHRKISNISKIVNPWLFKCQDHQCVSSLHHSYSFAPMTRHTGAFCVEGSVKQLIDCKSEFFNLRKTFTGDFSLPNCVNKTPLNEKQVHILTESNNRLYVHRESSHMILEDHFNAPITPLENVYEGLEPIVGKGVKKDKIKIPKCAKNENNKSIIGYPQRYYNCKSKQVESCSSKNKSVFIYWKCVDATVYPVFGDCHLFALGSSMTAVDRRRIFKCPSEVPIFNYLTKKCEADPPLGQLLCEQAYFKNFEAFSNPFQHFQLPEPNTYSELYKKQ